MEAPPQSATATATPAAAAAAVEYNQRNRSGAATAAASLFTAVMAPKTSMRDSTSSDNKTSAMTADQFLVEEFFDFSNEEDEEEDDDGLVLSANKNVNEFQSIKAADSGSPLLVASSCNSSLGGDLGNSNLSSDLCVPYDDLADLEWVSTFAEESFSSEDMEKLQFISGMSARTDEAASATHEPRPDPNFTKYRPEIPVPGKARSKRRRTAPGNWTSRLLMVSVPESDEAGEQKPPKKPKAVKKYGMEYLPVDGRKCLHCQTDKTPQWRTGPMGPKTLCNACGVRYKSGRLVPEYRPASSPTFIQTKHSNSHRKVLELRRQKEMIIMGPHHSHSLTHHHNQQQHQHQRYLEQQYRSMAYDGSNGDEYLDPPTSGTRFWPTDVVSGS